MSIETTQSIDNRKEYRTLTENEANIMFDDNFFRDLESTNPETKILIISEDNTSVYFEKPDHNKNWIRQIWSTEDWIFVDKFCVSKSVWQNARNEYNHRLWIQAVTDQTWAEIQWLNNSVQNVVINQWQNIPISQWQNIPISQWYAQESLNWSLNLQNHLWELLTKYENLKHWLKWAENNGQTKRNLKHQINENIESIKRIQKDLNKHPDYTDLSVYQERVAYLDFFLSKYELAREIVVLWWRTSDIPAIMDSTQDAKRNKKAQIREYKHQTKMNSLLRTNAMYSLMNGDNEAYEEYLEDVTNRMIEPSSHPFYARHKQSFMLIEQANPDLYKDLYPTWWNRTPYTVYCQTQNTPAWVSRYNKCDNFATKFGKDVSNIWEAFWWNKENDPRKRESWSKIWSFAAVWWAIFLWFKTLQSLFSKKHEWKRWKVAWYWTWLLALLNYDKIIWTLWDAIWWHPLEKQRATDALLSYWYNENDANNLTNYYSTPVLYTLNTMQYLPTSTFLNQNIIQNGANGLIFNYPAYESAINALAATDPIKYSNQRKTQLLKNAKKLSEDEALFRSGLWALGLTSMAAFSNIQHQEQPITQALNISENYVNYIESLTSWIWADLAKEWLKPKPEKIVEMSTQYNAPENENRKDELIKEWIKNWYVDLLDADKKYKLNEIISDPNIDLNNKAMKWFTNAWWTEITFDSYEELLDIIHLTNWIKENFKWRTAASDRPFHIAEFEPWRIEFDDVEWYKVWKNETDVLKARTIKKTSSLLSKNKENYVNYLNNWWQTEWKTK